MITGRTLKLFIIIFIVIWVPNSNATVHTVSNVNVIRTLTAGTKSGGWGGCMVQLDVNLKETVTGIDCHGSWVTFSCTGVHTTKSQGLLMFESAQLAFTLNKRVYLQVDDERKHGGHCFARRIDVLR